MRATWPASWIIGENSPPPPTLETPPTIEPDLLECSPHNKRTNYVDAPARDERNSDDVRSVWQVHRLSNGGVEVTRKTPWDIPPMANVFATAGRDA